MENKILFITNSFPKYFYRFVSMPIADEVKQYIEDRKIFIRFLDHKDNLYVRMYQNDYGWNDKEDLIKEFPELKFYNKKKINYKEFDLVVIDHPITSLLEVMQLNIPIIMFWSNLLWETNDKFNKYIQKFYTECIYWCYPDSAAFYLNENFNIKEWWESRDKDLINNFIKEFTSTKIQTIDKILKEVSNEQNNKK